MKGYQESELVSNRSGVLLWGGSEDDRRAWVEEVASRLGCQVKVVLTPADVGTALRAARDVVFIPGATLLPDEVQLAVVRCLREQEERPKLVLGVSKPADRTRLRPDLDYALALGRLDLDAPGVREAIRGRRKVAASKAAKKKKR